MPSTTAVAAREIAGANNSPARRTRRRANGFFMALGSGCLSKKRLCFANHFKQFPCLFRRMDLCIRFINLDLLDLRVGNALLGDFLPELSPRRRVGSLSSGNNKDVRTNGSRKGNPRRNKVSIVPKRRDDNHLPEYTDCNTTVPGFRSFVVGTTIPYPDIFHEAVLFCFRDKKVDKDIQRCCFPRSGRPVKGNRELNVVRSHLSGCDTNRLADVLATFRKYHVPFRLFEHRMKCWLGQKSGKNKPKRMSECLGKSDTLVRIFVVVGAPSDTDNGHVTILVSPKHGNKFAAVV